jgi:hypothetical protein
MKTAEEEIKYAIKEAIQVLEHYDNREDFALSTCLKRLKDIDASQFKAGEVESTCSHNTIDLDTKGEVRCTVCLKNL